MKMGALLFLRLRFFFSKRKCLWVRSPVEAIKYLFKLIFSFLRSGVDAERGV